MNSIESREKKMGIDGIENLVLLRLSFTLMKGAVEHLLFFSSLLFQDMIEKRIKTIFHDRYVNRAQELLNDINRKIGV